MAVLLEGISVIVIRARIDDAYPGGWTGFVADSPNQTLCADSEVARVGFMVPADVDWFLERLRRAGLVDVIDDCFVDCVVVDQILGPMRECPWLECATGEIPDGTVTACWLLGSEPGTVEVPEGWTWKGSLSEKPHFAPADQVAHSFEFLRHEDGVDVFLDRLTGKVGYVGRTSDAPIVPPSPRAAKDRN